MAYSFVDPDQYNLASAMPPPAVAKPPAVPKPTTAPAPPPTSQLTTSSTGQTVPFMLNTSTYGVGPKTAAERAASGLPTGAPAPTTPPPPKNLGAPGFNVGNPNIHTPSPINGQLADISSGRVENGPTQSNGLPGMNTNAVTVTPGLTKAPGAAPAGPDANTEQMKKDASTMWASALSDHDAQLPGLYKQANADEAGAARRNAEMNAVSGGGASGAFAGGQAQVAIGGMQARQKAFQDFNKQGVELKMARLDQLIKQAEASGDRNLQRELQAESDKTALMLKQFDVQGTINQTNTLTNSLNSTGG